MTFQPRFERRCAGDLCWHEDVALREEHGIIVAFSERSGGVSTGPYESLNLASHVGDDPSAVDENRSRLLEALGLADARSRLTMSQQVHGDVVAEVGPTDVGAGACASGGRHPLPESDALLTAEPDTPLLMCYADCVPVVLAATGPVRAVAVVHAGWRGALARVPSKAATRLAQRAGCDLSQLVAYVGPRICGSCFEVGDEVVSQFRKEFVTIRVARGRMDLGAVVSGDLIGAGMLAEMIAPLGACTLEDTGRFYSYRSSRVTGRHGALAVIV